MNLGHDHPDDLAFDVDENMDDEDPEALDSDDERALDEELSIDFDGESNSDSGPNTCLSYPHKVPMHVVPLYSLLPSEKQMRVFEPLPPGSCLVIIATNVAETSLTIPGIRYVVDCGRAKEVSMSYLLPWNSGSNGIQCRYDVKNGIQAFVVNWISKASAAQRAGHVRAQVIPIDFTLQHYLNTTLIHSLVPKYKGCPSKMSYSR